jgi:hypothetical protein
VASSVEGSRRPSSVSVSSIGQAASAGRMITYHRAAESRLWWRRLLPWMLVVLCALTFFLALGLAVGQDGDDAAVPPSVFGALGGLALFCALLFLPLRPASALAAADGKGWAGAVLLFLAGCALLSLSAVRSAATLTTMSGAALFATALCAFLLTVPRDSAWKVAKALASRNGPISKADIDIAGQVYSRLIDAIPQGDPQRPFDDAKEELKEDPEGFSRHKMGGFYGIALDIVRSELKEIPEEMRYRFPDQVDFGAIDYTEERARAAKDEGKTKNPDETAAALFEEYRNRFGKELLEKPARIVRPHVKRQYLEPWI